jgi:protein TonB
VAAAPPTAPAAPPPAAPAPKKEEIDYGELTKKYAYAWQQEVGRRVNGKVDYPRLAQQKGWEGTARIRVEIGRDGKVRAVALSQSSGYELLDVKALEIVKRVRVPPVPSQLIGREFSVDFPIAFKIPKG